MKLTPAYRFRRRPLSRSRARALAIGGPLLLASLAVVSQWYLLVPALFWPLLGIAALLATWEGVMLLQLQAVPRHSTTSDLRDIVNVLDGAAVRREIATAIMIGVDDSLMVRRELENIEQAVSAHAVVRCWDGRSILVVAPVADESAGRALVESLHAAASSRHAGMAASVGWSAYPLDAATADELVRRAELALHACRRDHAGSVHRSSEDDAWLDEPDRVASVLELITTASDLRGAPSGYPRATSEIAQQAAVELGLPTLEVLLAQGAALIWDARLAAVLQEVDGGDGSATTFDVRCAHVDQVVEALERYGVLRLLPGVHAERPARVEELAQVAQLLAIIDRCVVLNGVGINPAELVEAACKAYRAMSGGSAPANVRAA